MDEEKEEEEEEEEKALIVPSDEAEIIVWFWLIKRRSFIQSECAWIVASGVLGLS